MAELSEILIVDLYRAIDNDDPSIIGKDVTYEDFEALVDKFMEEQKGPPSIKEKRKSLLDVRIRITTACLIYLEQVPFDYEIFAVLRENKWVIEKDTYKKNVEDIISGVKRLLAKSDLLEKDLKVNKPSGRKLGIYDILAGMSAGLDGIYLDPRKITAIEFISYQKVIERKAERYAAIKTNK